MGLEAKDRMSKFIYGSHSIDIAGKIDCPVIIVPSKYKTHKLSKIVLTVDSNEKMHKPTLSGFEKFVEKSKIKLGSIIFIIVSGQIKLTLYLGAVMITGFNFYFH